MSSRDELRILREEVKKVTAEIIRLCGVRLSLVSKIGEIKLMEGLPIEDSRVEKQLREAILENCRLYGINSQFGLRIFNLLLEESKRFQRDLTE